MRRLTLAAALVAAVLLTWPPLAAAGPHYPDVGFGEQRASVFENRHWQALGVRHMRLVVGWDALRYRWQRNEIDTWMRAAEAAGARVLVSFTRSRASSRKRAFRLPSAKAYRRNFRRFRARYPGVREFIPWNEANHCSQPTCRRPKRAARYFDVMRSACPKCTVVAADVLDSSDMTRWLRSFVRAARHKPRIWGLHNYLDANYFRTRGTRAMLRAVKGRIWFTETGGLVKRRATTSPHRFPDSRAHAAKAVDWVLGRLARLSPRVDRVYLYHFQNQGRNAAWDSGVLDSKGRPRPAYGIVAKWIARAQRARAQRTRAGGSGS